MKWVDRMSDKIKTGIRNWLNVAPTTQYAVQIMESMDFELNAIRNKIWNSADANKIEQLYMQVQEVADGCKFWASKCSPGMEMRKIHTGLPNLIVKVLSGIVSSGMEGIEFENPAQEEIWKNITKNIEFKKLFKKSIKDILVVGDGAYRVVIDTNISPYPMIEWVPGDKIEVKYSHGIVREVIFKSFIESKKKKYVLNEHYGYGYMYAAAYEGDKEIDMSTLTETVGLPTKDNPITFDSSQILAKYIQVWESGTYEGRGASVYDGKLDAFDAFDEAWSQWMDALRAGRAKSYVPECLIPHDPETGALLKPNAFDNRYFAADGDMREGQKNEVRTVQPVIPHDSYMATYCTALDMCLQGIISPSTLGIDVKKLDNAEAQREKEKTTLYTRDDIVEAIQKQFPDVIQAAVNAYNILNKQAPEEVKTNIIFAEYANPSFESQIETIGKARTQGVMSIERSVEELYGDTLDEEAKAEEVKRLKEEAGILMVEEPAVRTQAGEFEV